MLVEEEASWLKAVEVVLWSLPTLGALALLRGAAAGERRQWAFIAAASGVFALDEVLDLLGRAYALAHRLAWTLDPEHAFRGEHLIWRLVILGVAALGAVGVLAYLFRGGRVGVSKWVAFSGVCTVAVYVILRLVPGIGSATSGPVGWGILGLAWCLLMGGEALELDRRRDRDA